MPEYDIVIRNGSIVDGTLAPALDESSVVDAVSIEDAHRKNDLSLLAHFRRTKVILGSIDVASSRVETTEEIKERPVLPSRVFSCSCSRGPR